MRARRETACYTVATMRGYGPFATAFLLVALTLAAGCSSGSTTSSPTPTPSSIPSQIAPITMVPTASPTPTAAVPKVDPLTEINSDISFLENIPLPDGVLQATWDLAKLNALQGSHDQGGNYGLYDVRTALQNGDTVTANQMLSSDLFNKVIGFGVTSPNQIVTRSKDDIEKLDPRNLLIPSGVIGFGFAVSTENVALDLIKVKYALQP